MPRRTKPRDPTRIPRFLLLLGVFLCPLVFDRGAFKPFDIPKIGVVWILAFLALGIWTVELIRGRVIFARSRSSLVAMGFLAAVGLATIFSVTQLVSLTGWYGRYQGFVQYLLYVAMFCLLVQLYWRKPERTREIVFALGAASVLVVAYVIVQELGLDPFRWERLGGGKVRFRNVGPVGNANFCGGFLGATLPWLVFAFWRARSVRLKGLLVAWGLVTLWAMALTGSRGGYLAGLAGGVLSVYLFRDRFPRLMMRVAAVAAALAVVGGILAFALGPAQEGVLRNQSLKSRFTWWGAAARMFADRPVLGSGPDTFVVVYPRYASQEEFTGAEYPDKPHNILFDHAASLGVLGLGSYLALIALIALRGARRMRALSRGEQDLLGTFMAMTGAYLAQGMFSIDTPVLAVTGWVMLAGAAVFADPKLDIARERFASEPPRPKKMTWPRWTAVAATTLLTVFAVVIGVRPWVADRLVHDAVVAQNAEPLSIVLDRYDRAMELYPVNPIYPGMAGDYLRRLSVDKEQAVDSDTKQILLADSVDYFEHMDSLQPRYHLWKMSVGESVGLLATVAKDDSLFADADFWFVEAQELGPYDFRVALRYGDMLRGWGAFTRDSQKFCEAVEQFELGVNLRDDRVGLWIGLGAAYANLGQLDKAEEAADRALEVNPGSALAQRLQAQLKDLRKKELHRIECT